MVGSERGSIVCVSRYAGSLIGDVMPSFPKIKPEAQEIKSAVPGRFGMDGQAGEMDPGFKVDVCLYLNTR